MFPSQQQVSKFVVLKSPQEFSVDDFGNQTNFFVVSTQQP